MSKNIIASAIAIIILFMGGFYLSRHFNLTDNNAINATSINSNNNGFSISTTTDTNMETINGLKIEILKQGAGEAAKNGDRVTVHYVGTLLNGEKFDSSIDRGQPFSFILGNGQVIEGWEKGILGMKVGEKRKLTIPPELGYGMTGTPGGPIPPNATLIFEVELLKIN